MNTQPQPRTWVDRWLNNGANLITLSRLPMTLAVMALIYWLCFVGTEQYQVAVFWTLVFVQAIGMITDGIDGWYARKYGGGGTPEGQFLDQFIDKVYVWAIWVFASITLVIHGQLVLFQLPWVLLWGSLSAWLIYRDSMSCKKHWSNYLRDRDQPFNKKSGAISWGKRKFFFENVALCVILLAIAPTAKLASIPFIGTLLQWDSQFVTELAIGSLLVAIICAEISVRKRGVILTRDQKLEAKHRPAGFAEAVADLDERV